MQMTTIITALTALLLCVCYYDFRWMIIPNWVTAGVAGLGIVYNRAAVTASGLPIALLFAFGVFAAFWFIKIIYERWRGVAGLGFGDVKFAGAAAIWLSPLNFPAYLLMATSSALIFFLVSSNRASGSLSRRLPFGPFLALALLISVLAEHSLAGIY